MKRQTKLRKKLLAALIASGVASTLGLPTMVWAQSANANLRGTAPPNAQVTARNAATGEVRSTTASGSGSYVLIGLQPGTWRVDAGPGTEQTVTLSVASTATLNLSAAAAPAAPTAAPTLGTVQVVGRQLVDMKTSQVGETVSLHQIQTMPQVTRNFLEFADTIPGMIFTVQQNGNTSITSGAQNVNAINVFIDGVSQKGYVRGGGITGQEASRGNPFPQLAIGQYKVLTSNYKAEYDQVSSAAITAVTKSGTNEFHGEVYGNYTDASYRSATPSEENAGVKADSRSKEYGFALGGPIIKDKMHFFITNSVKRFVTPTAVVPGVDGVTDLLPPDAQAQAGPASIPFFENLFFGKLDWEPTDRDRLELRAQIRRETELGSVGGTGSPSHGISTKNDVKRYELYWSHGGDSWFNEALLTYQNAFWVPTPITFGIGQVYTFGPENNATILQTGAPDPRAGQNKGQKGPGFKDDLTFTDLHWLGDHVVKMGIRYQKIELVAQDAGDDTAAAFYNVCPAVPAQNCPPGSTVGTAPTPYKVTFGAPAVGFSPIVRSQDKQYGAYIQDDWTVNEHWTFNLGVRWDMEKNPSYLNWVTPANVVAALNSPYPAQDPQFPQPTPGETYADGLRLGGVDVNDYISNGHNRSPFKDAWQPRLGFSYDINGDQQHVIFGGAGRAYDRNLYDYLQLEQTKFALGQFTYYFSTPTVPCTGTPCLPWDPKYLDLGNLQALVQASNEGQEYDAINNDIKVPYSDQFSLGIRNRLGDWNTSATVARVLSKDGFVFTLGNRYANGAFWANGGQPWGQGIPGFGSLIIGNSGIETRSTQLLLYAEKPYTQDSRWGVTISYTYTNAHQNRDINEHYSFDEATIEDYPFILSNAAPKHRLVATAVADGPWGITFSGKLTLATPTPINGIACYGATFPNGSSCTSAATIPSGGKHFVIGGPIWGYRDIDLTAIKNWNIAGNVTLYGRLDVLNVFNYKNFVDTTVNWGVNGVFDPVASYNTTGNITGVPRTIKFTVGMRW
ncbi:MAG TPA: TonB-dependent receptor [Rhodanobacteraceae bacterium]|nr:TonB-dependent receptor [Rhodanobacteraceae bacterium]